MLFTQIETPALLLDLDSFEHNLQLAAHFCSDLGLAMRPHYKSHKCTFIAHKQIDYGAKGICCATLGEAEDLILSGIDDVLIANQVIGKSKVFRLASLAGKARLSVCVDHTQNIDELQQAAAFFDSKIYCLVEYDVGMARLGVQSHADFLDLINKISQCDHLVFEGIQAYAGHIAHTAPYEERLQKSRAINEVLIELKQSVESQGCLVKEVSGISTGTLLLQGKDTVYTEAQAGSYIFMDASYQVLDLPFRQSLHILGTVMKSCDDYLVSDIGLKSVGTDQKAPYYLDYLTTPIRFSEEHSCANITGYEMGDTLFMVPGHVCTTVNLYDAIYLTRDGVVVDKISVTSRGKSQ